MISWITCLISALCGPLGDSEGLSLVGAWLKTPRDLLARYRGASPVQEGASLSLVEPGWLPFPAAVFPSPPGRAPVQTQYRLFPGLSAEGLGGGWYGAEGDYLRHRWTARRAEAWLGSGAEGPHRLQVHACGSDRRVRPTRLEATVNGQAVGHALVPPRWVTIHFPVPPQLVGPSCRVVLAVDALVRRSGARGPEEGGVMINELALLPLGSVFLRASDA